MGYVAVRGGAEAIRNVEDLLRWFRTRGGTPPITVPQIQDQLRLAVDKVMAEGSLYSPALAALALKQAEGDTIEAAFLLRAYRSTLPRLGYSLPLETAAMWCIRRISSAFKDVPGGQILGPTRDYTQRLLDFHLLRDAAEEPPADPPRVPLPANLPEELPKVTRFLRQEGLLDPPREPVRDEPPVDVTRQALTFPAPRSARLQILARGEDGALLALAYSSHRGFGNIHPTLAELRVGHVPVRIVHPLLGEAVEIGRILVTEVELIARYGQGEAEGADAGDGRPRFTLGYGLTFGQNERKAIAIATLDRAMRAPRAAAPCEDQEFVLYHVDGVESQGFTNHWKLPHYVDFQSELDRLRKMRAAAEATEESLPSLRTERTAFDDANDPRGV